MSDTEPGSNHSIDSPYAIRVQSVTKRFLGITANQDVSLSVESGTFHAIIGENGAGKSTLLNVLYGRYRAESGRVAIHGEDVTNALNSPADAIRRGVGLVTQHYSLIPALTVLENIVLGAESCNPAGFLNNRSSRAKIQSLTQSLGLEELDLSARAESVSVAIGQKIEIVKALYRGARILLLDEPTATLAPQEAAKLFELLQTLIHNGTTIVFVTHKLREVMAYSHNVTVLRSGRNAGDFVTANTSAEELLSRMIGPRDSGDPIVSVREEPAPAPNASIAGRALLLVEEISVTSRAGNRALESVSVQVDSGEIVGVAGVDGSGQRELAQAIVGLRTAVSGQIRLQASSSDSPTLLNRKSVRERQRLGIAYIPEDRHRQALILDFDLAENYMLGHETDTAWGGGLLLKPKTVLNRANEMIQRFDVRLGQRDARTSAGMLSGGNQQKAVIARALGANPLLLVACQPTRGLDVEAARFVYKTIRKAKSQGLGILLFSLDLDEILDLSDRIVVLYNGRVAGWVDRADATPERIGALMTGAGEIGAKREATGAQS